MPNQSGALLSEWQELYSPKGVTERRKLHALAWVHTLPVELTRLTPGCGAHMISALSHTVILMLSLTLLSPDSRPDLLQVFALWKHLVSQEIPEGSWLWFLDGDAVITNFTSDVLEHVRSAPIFQAQFEEYKDAVATDPSIFMAAHNVKPWPIFLVRCMNFSPSRLLRSATATAHADVMGRRASKPTLSELTHCFPAFPVAGLIAIIHVPDSSPPLAFHRKTRYRPQSLSA